MTEHDTRYEKAARPEDLTRLFVERANAKDADGIAALYEPGAVMAYPPGEQTAGRNAIREFWEKALVARRQPDGTWLRLLDYPELGRLPVNHPLLLRNGPRRLPRCRPSARRPSHYDQICPIAVEHLIVI
jgi:hypothetical protein